jgi:uncharacterized membrane protein YeaQ/YmgE (transglycosylase-associated protein family)
MEVEMNWILWIIFGAIAGWIASIIMGRNAQMGALANIVVGIVGAIIGGWLMTAFGGQGVTGFNLVSLIVRKPKSRATCTALWFSYAGSMIIMERYGEATHPCP